MSWVERLEGELVAELSQVPVPRSSLPQTILVGGLIWVAVLLAGFATWYAVAFSNRGPAVKRFIATDPSDLIRITFTPSEPPYASPFRSPLILTSRGEIARVVSALREAVEVQPNHPAAVWNCFISVEDSSGTSYGTLSATRDQGILLSVHSGPKGGWNLGSYKVNAIGPVVSGLASSGAAQ